MAWEETAVAGAVPNYVSGGDVCREIWIGSVPGVCGADDDPVISAWIVFVATGNGAGVGDHDHVQRPSETVMDRKFPNRAAPLINC